MSLRADDGNLQVPSWDRHQRGSGIVQVLGSSTINVCCQWQHAALFRKEHLDEYSKEAASDRSVEQAEPTDHLANADVQLKVSIADGLAEVQALEKTDWIKTCLDLADHFTVTIFDKYRDADEIRLIFDRFVTPADIYLVTFVFILVIITYINGHVILLLGMMYHCF